MTDEMVKVKRSNPLKDLFDAVLEKKLAQRRIKVTPSLSAEPFTPRVNIIKRQEREEIKEMGIKSGKKYRRMMKAERRERREADKTTKD